MPENKDYMTHPEELGCIHISEDVLASIASGAAVEVEGVGGMMNLAAAARDLFGPGPFSDSFRFRCQTGKSLLYFSMEGGTIIRLMILPRQKR